MSRLSPVIQEANRIALEDVDKAEAAYDLANNKACQTAAGPDKAAADAAWDKYIRLKREYEKF
jgi:hypothetical protein